MESSVSKNLPYKVIIHTSAFYWYILNYDHVKMKLKKCRLQYIESYVTNTAITI
jgi:hypothetical protein